MTFRTEAPSNRREGTETRRAALRHLGGGAALAVLATAGLGGRVIAQQATPAASEDLEGRYAVVRMRKVKADKSGDDLAALVREGFVPLLREIPGFVSYLIVWNAETRDWLAVGVFADETGAAESNARPAEWGSQSGANDFVEGDPVVVEGTVAVAAGATA